MAALFQGTTKQGDNDEIVSYILQLIENERMKTGVTISNDTPGESTKSDYDTDAGIGNNQQDQAPQNRIFPSLIDLIREEATRKTAADIDELHNDLDLLTRCMKAKLLIQSLRHKGDEKKMEQSGDGLADGVISQETERTMTESTGEILPVMNLHLKKQNAELSRQAVFLNLKMRELQRERLDLTNSTFCLEEQALTLHKKIVECDQQLEKAKLRLDKM